MDSATQPWSQVFRQTVAANCRYWLNCAQDNVNKVLPETPQVLRGLSYAFSVSQAWKSARDLTLRFSPSMIRQGQGVTWESFLTKGIALSSEEKDSAEIEFRLQLGLLYRLQGRLSEAQNCFREALNLCERYELSTHCWTLINQLGFVARLSAQHEEALAYCQQVLAGQDVPASERAEALNVMGLVAHDCNQWEEAQHCFEQALSLYRWLDDPYQIARMLNNQGLVLFRINRWDEAEKSYREAIQQFQVANDQAERFKTVMNLGNVFLMREEYQSAIGQYHEALPVFQQCNYVVELAHIYNNLGMAHTGLADWQAAKDYFLASIEAWQNLGDAYNLANVMDNLGDMFIKAGQLRETDEILRQALQILSTAPDSAATTYLRGEIEGRLNQLIGEVASDCS